MLNINPDIKPVTQKLRRIPYHLRLKVKTEIEDLLSKDIIEPIPPNEPTPWISPLVIVPKRQDGESIRLCIDMKEANKAILRERSLTPTVEDVMYQLNGATLFSKLDMNKGYHQLVLDPKSRAITTFVMHLGLFRYRRLHFGVNTAAEIFQHEISKLLQSIPNALNISDDILIFGKTQTEHDKALKDTMQKLQEAGVTLNRDKCLFNKKTLKFLGHVFSDKGVTPDRDRIQAIQALQSPTNPSEVRSFLGMVMFSSRFLPHLATLAKPLRQLTRYEQPWRWSEDSQRVFDKIKLAMSKATMLSYFDKALQTEVWTDASPAGIGAILLQRETNGDMKLLAHASHAFTDIECRYSQIEREALALVWSTNHFHLYLYGNPFKLVTDHKPLVTIFADNRHALSARLERWKLKLQSYQYIVEYSPGKHNPADYMSRHPIENAGTATTTEKSTEAYVNFIIQQAKPIKLTLDEIKKGTKADNTLSAVFQALAENDWKKHPQDVNRKHWQALYKIRHELSTNSTRDVILRGPRIVLPVNLQDLVVNMAHIGHLGIVKTKSMLRDKVWFPGIDDRVERVVLSCKQCSTVTPQRGTTPLQPTELPEGPWKALAIDHKGPLPNGDYLLVVTDQYSKFPVVETVSSTSAKQNISKLDHIFAMFGTPIDVVTDNGSPFNSIDFKQFANRLGFRHRKITPRWPQANGQVERFNAVLNKSLRISFANNLDYKLQLNDMLRAYRMTPHNLTKCTPSELLFGYSIRSQIPDARDLEHPIDQQTLKSTISESQDKMKAYHNSSHTMLAEPHIGDTVLLKNEHRTKGQPFYHNDAYQIKSIKGPMVTAQNDKHAVTRHRSFYKIIPNMDAQELKTGSSSQDEESLHDEDTSYPSQEPDQRLKCENISPPSQEPDQRLLDENIPPPSQQVDQDRDAPQPHTPKTISEHKGYYLRPKANRPKRLIEQ